jgi:Putative transposase/Transposase zinc-binding domain
MVRGRAAPPVHFERHPGAASAPLPASYVRHEPEKTVLYGVVAEVLETFLAEARERTDHGMGVPRFVEEEFRKFLRCGILSQGFARIRCATCGFDRLLAFSCKVRTLCASCLTRRMHDTAEHLVANVLPQAAYRQWVISYPKWVRYRLACDAKLASKARQLFVRAIFTLLRRRARRRGIAKPLVCAVAFEQRFGSTLTLNLHYHVAVADGVFVAAGGTLAFHLLPPPTDDEIAALTERMATKIIALLARSHDEDVTPDDDGLLVERHAAAMNRITVPPDAAPHMTKTRCAFLNGFSVHADVHIHPNDRLALKRLLAYAARPPCPEERLTRLPDGKIKMRLKHPGPGGQHQILFEPQDLVRRLASLIPPRRRHLITYFGLASSHAQLRPHLVALVPTLGPSEMAPAQPLPSPIPVRPRRTRLPWADLLRNVFAIDVLQCPRCPGRMTVIAVVTDPGPVQAILAHLGLPTQAPLLAPARAPPQLALLGDSKGAREASDYPDPPSQFE